VNCNFRPINPKKARLLIWGRKEIGEESRFVICDPACRTGGFLLAAHEFIRRQKLDKAQLRYLNAEQLRGVELVDGVARLCAMNVQNLGSTPIISMKGVADTFFRPIRKGRNR
jgi:hypothetical protein